MTIELGRTRVFADGADRDGILELRSDPMIRGFTTNPTLMRNAGVEDYEAFVLDIVGLSSRIARSPSRSSTTIPTEWCGKR